MKSRCFPALCAFLASVTLDAAPSLVLEQPEGTILTAGASVAFGGMQSQYLDPASQTQAGDNTFTVTFAGVPPSAFSTYQIQRSFDGQQGWLGLFAPGLEPGVDGAIVFHDLTPLVNAFYRLLIQTDTRRVFTIRNTGDTDLTDLAVTVTGNEAASFELDLSLTETMLTAGRTTTFAVTYVANDGNARSAELQVTANVGTPLTLSLAGGDSTPVTPPKLVNVTINPAGLETPATIAGAITNGPANGTVFLEASADFGQLDTWASIATIVLDANGGAAFGDPLAIADPGSLGSFQNFYRVRVQ